ncbi:hypothetical protein [Actinomadura macrotermitis]|uniref:Uncharacterized protein n=1 Tax=Actinomadura macrotermitis TaxID=2585200 RepID=A0A7K0BSI4_9ACTN|nr:hypothetical protein [Actinomadura macrotermitis]MQY03842.1 hypothetical protein [Actinomadura macrotermitis]
MEIRSGFVAFCLGALVPFAGLVAAALAVTAAVVAAPGLARSAGFTSAAMPAAALLNLLLAFAGAWLAGRRLLDAGAPTGRAAAIACAGPLLVGLLTQTGIAAQGRPLVLLLVLGAAAAGAGLGFGMAARRR